MKEISMKAFALIASEQPPTSLMETRNVDLGSGNKLVLREVSCLT